MIAPLLIGQIDRLTTIAQHVTIVRDTYGVPHVQAPTDAGCVFGLMFAQAEDHFAQVETQIIADIGRASEVFGPSRLESDVRFQLFEVEARAKKEYASSSLAMRTIANAYADGLNYFVVKHPEVKPRLLSRFEPWFMFANQAGPGGIPAEAGTRTVMTAVEDLTTEAPKIAPTQPEEIDRRAALEMGSNAWAIAPKRTTGGHAILFSNPHVSFFGADVRYECHLHSGEGWDFSGFVTLGNPIPHAGHNAHLGWTHTNTVVDTADVYAETPLSADQVKYGSEKRPIESWTASIRVKTETGMTTRKFKFRKTQHGPIVAKSGDRLLALKWQHMDRGGYWSEKYAMGKARNLDEFRRALSIRAIPASNTTYADDAGHIAFWYGNAAPKRPEGVDPSKVLDGADPNTEWQGYHSIDELPHVIDPASGWLQNCNSDPEHTTADGNPVRTSFRKYLIGDSMTARAENSRRILASQDKFSYADLEKLAFDTTVFTAIKRVPIMLAGAEQTNAVRMTEVQEAIKELRAWDHRATLDSVATTLYVLAEEEAWNAESSGRRRGMATETVLGGALVTVILRLEQDFGTWRVAWKEVNRLQRPANDATRPRFDENASSLPCLGVPGITGTIFAFYPASTAGVKRRFGNMGDSYVALTEFAAKPRAKSIYVFGQSGHPESPHWFDQAPLYVVGKFKDAWFDWSEVQNHAEHTYHPGE